MSVIDCQQLIALVYDNPEIWDRKAKGYHNRNYLHRCWKEISLKMQIPEDKLRKKWKYLRDQYAIEASRHPGSGDESDDATTCKWHYYKPLHFLRNIVKVRDNLTQSEKPKHREDVLNSVVKNSETNDEGVMVKVELIEDADDPNVGELFEENASSVGSESFTSETLKQGQSLVKRVKRLRTDPYATSVLESDLFGPQIHDSSEEEHLLFFRSLLPHVKKIPAENILTFRSRIQEIVQEFAYSSNYLYTRHFETLQSHS